MKSLSKSLSVAVWKTLEATPGFNKAMERGIAQIDAGKIHPLTPIEPPMKSGSTARQAKLPRVSE